MMSNNEVATRFIEGALGKCNLKQQKFVAQIVLGKDPNEVIKEQYNISDNDMVEIKKIQLMSNTEIKNAIIELQGGTALVTKAKLNSMMPKAMGVLQEAIEDESPENKYIRLATSKDVVKMGLDMQKADSKGNEKPTTIIKIDNINSFTHGQDMSKIAKSFMDGVVPEVIDAEIEEVEVVDEVIPEKPIVAKSLFQTMVDNEEKNKEEKVAIKEVIDDDCPY